MGFGAFVAPLFGCLWTRVVGPRVLRGHFSLEFWYQQREEHSAGWIFSGPHGIPLRQVHLIEGRFSFLSFFSSQVLQCCDPGHGLSYLTFRLLFMCPTKGFYRVKRVYSLTTGNLRIYLMFYWCVFSKIRPLLLLEFFICRVFFLSNAD